MPNSYIIVDDPKQPTKYWRYGSWVDSRTDAYTYSQSQCDGLKLPTGGVWLLINENQVESVKLHAWDCSCGECPEDPTKAAKVDYDVPHAPVPYDSPKPFQVNLCQICGWELDYEPVHGKAEKSAVPIQNSDETLFALKAIRARWSAGAGVNPRSPTDAEREAIEDFEQNACADMEWLISGYDTLLSQRDLLVEVLKACVDEGLNYVLSVKTIEQARAALTAVKETKDLGKG